MPIVQSSRFIVFIVIFVVAIIMKMVTQGSIGDEIIHQNSFCTIIAIAHQLHQVFVVDTSEAFKLRLEWALYVLQLLPTFVSTLDCHLFPIRQLCFVHLPEATSSNFVGVAEIVCDGS
jgi:hypothetical protein